MSRPSERRGSLVGALALIAIGVVCWAVARSGTASSGHAYSTGGVPPSTVQLEQGHTYFLAVPGGIGVLDDQRLDAASLRCTATAADGSATGLTLHAESSDTKAINAFASFAAPGSGRYGIGCTGLTGVFVDDAQDAGADHSGMLLLVAVVTLAIGLPLLLSVLRRRRPAVPAS